MATTESFLVVGPPTPKAANRGEIIPTQAGETKIKRLSTLCDFARLAPNDIILHFYRVVGLARAVGYDGGMDDSPANPVSEKILAVIRQQDGLLGWHESRLEG
jgi:hypothetical protein